MRARWFDYHLKGIENGVDKEAPVKIFVMGANKWRDEQEWPIAVREATRYYLHSKGQANTRFGDGTLTPTRRRTSRPTDFATIRAIPCRRTAVTDAATTDSRRWVRSISA